jgi:hypothetical protein
VDKQWIMQYAHTQQGWWHYLLYAMAIFVLGMSWRDPNAPPLLLPMFALLFVFVAQLFQTLTVKGSGNALTLRYGPVPLLSKRIGYESIRGVEVERLSWFDGWGIHWVPGRGWTYSLWGFDCVKLKVGNRSIRIGTDDAENLAAFLRQKMEAQRNDAAASL